MKEKIILLVEDNSDDEMLMLRALRKNNISNEIVIARDGVEALDYLFGTDAYAERSAVDVPGLVLLDLKLPKVGGLEVLKRMRANNRTRLIPVVMLTYSDEEKDIITSYKLGCNSYVRKPVKFRDFLETVRRIVLYWLHINVTQTAARED